MSIEVPVDILWVCPIPEVPVEFLEATWAPVRTHSSSGDACLQLQQPALDPVSGDIVADIESSSSVGEEGLAEAPPRDAHEPLQEPAAR